MAGSVKPRQSFRLASTISAFFETAFVLRVNLPKWCRVLLLSRSIAICAFIVRLTAGKARLRTIRGKDLFHF